MVRDPRRFEHYAMRVTCVVVVGLIAWYVLHGKGLAYAFYGFLLARAAVKGVDFPSAQNWWITLIFVAFIAAATGTALYVNRRDPLEERWILLFLTATSLAQTMLLLSGRWRRVWSFACRPVPEGS